MNKLAIYPGCFDPITLGHVDIIERASLLFDSLHIVIAENLQKSSMFTVKDRLNMAINSVKHIDNVVVNVHNGLITDYAKEIGARAMVRGIRTVSDVDYEFQLAFFNRKLAPQITTIFLAPANEYTYISSSSVRELIKLKQNIDEFVPVYAAEFIRKII
ncbi:MAG: pantetheine-phosphate adenylyltransferase [bacterium]